MKMITNNIGRSEIIISKRKKEMKQEKLETHYRHTNTVNIYVLM